MRLRLCVQRNGLPPTNVVWSIPETNSTQAYTIARLLEDVNQIIPIEAEEWGYEDYIVEVGGYECLHFAPVSQALREDDLVSIRPLLTAEVRGRTLSGRYQISDGGQHLVDGIPFGRPYLRNPTRPSIVIPSRKRKRLLEDDAESGHEAADSLRLITANGEDVGSPKRRGNTTHTAVAECDAPQKTLSHSGTKTVRFHQVPTAMDDDSDEDDDDDFEPDGSGNSDASMGDASDSSSDSDDSESPDESSVISDTSSEDSDSESESDSDSESSSDSSSDSGTGSSVSEEPIGRRAVVPTKGKSQTKARNRRRKLSTELKNLKNLGILSHDARLVELEEWKSQDKATKEQQLAEAKIRLAASRKHDVTVNDHPTLEEAKQLLLSHYGDESAREDEVAKPDGKPESKPDVKQEATPHEQGTVKTSQSAQEPPRKRLRPNVSAIARIIGHQARPLKKKSDSQSKPAPAEEDVPVDPDYWKSRVNVSAFECWFEDVELSAPPFPFEQHWDSASREMKDRDKAKQGKKRKRVSNSSHATPTPEDEAAQLDYGDDDGVPVLEHRDDEAAVDAQLIQEVHAAAKVDLPPLPESVDLLPQLSKENVKVGTVVAFKVIEFAPGTMTPAISDFKTAIVEKLDESGEIGLRLAERDVRRKEKKYDAKGRRIYDAADALRMEDSDDEGGDKLEWKEFEDLLEAKLVQPTATAQQVP